MSNLLEKASILTTPTAYENGKILSVKPAPSLGSELVVNGDFATDSNWFKDANWSIANGKATSTGVGRMFQSIPFLETNIGTTVQVSFDIIDITANGVVVNCYGGVSQLFTTVGTHTFTTTTINNTNLYFNNGGAGNLIGSIDNVSVKQVIDGDFDFTRNSSATRVNSQGLIEDVQILSSNLVSNGDFSNGSTGWTLGTGWSIGDDKATATDAAFGAQIVDNTTLVANKKYKVTFDISDYVKGNVRVGVGNVFSSEVSSNGSFTFIITSSNTNAFKAQTRAGGSGTTLSISNISVIEITEDTNLPRIDYTGGEGHWLFEPQSTNLIIQSENLSSVDWTKSLVTVSANDIASPSGEVNASLIQETVYTSSIPSLKTTNNIPISTGKHTLSFYVKNNNGRYLGISFGNNANRIRTTFDFDTETFKTPLFNGITEGEVSYTTIGDYYRILITANFTSGISGLVYIMPLATDSYPFFEFQNSDNRSFYLWGAQVEAQSYATSYIPTSGSTVTRLQDAAFGAGSSDLINSTEGVLYAEIAALSDGGVRKISISDGSLTNYVSFEYSVITNLIRVRLVSGGVEQSFYQSTSYGYLQYHKIAISYKINDFKIYIDGLIAHTDTSSIMPIGLNILNFSSGNGAEPFFGKTKCVAVFKEALTDAELTCLTTI